MARPIRTVLTKVTELLFQNISPPWFFKVQQLLMTQINRTDRKQINQLSFFQNSSILLKNHLKTVFCTS
jgi:hypothetical protein